MTKLTLTLLLGAVFSLNSKCLEEFEVQKHYPEGVIIKNPVDTVSDITKSAFYVRERLPTWFLGFGMLDGLVFKEDYEFDNRLNPLYLEADFNGDGQLDLAIPIKEIATQKVGFAIIHGQTREVYIMGAGTQMKKGLSDNMGYIDIWKVNRDRVNAPGLGPDGEVDDIGPLILDHPSLEISKSEVGGGLIYWDGQGYAYFHQTC